MSWYWFLHHVIDRILVCLPLVHLLLASFVLCAHTLSICVCLELAGGDVDIDGFPRRARPLCSGGYRSVAFFAVS